MSEDRDFEAEARAGGWVPEEEYKGENPPKEFVDAKTFVERGEKIAGLMKNKVETLESKVNELTRANAEFREFHQKSLESERRKAEERIAELERERAQAIEQGDGQTYTRADRELQELRAQPTNTTYNAVVEEWQAQNLWYGTNDRLTAFADGVSEKIAAEGYTGRAYLAELSRRTKEAFPEDFGNPRRSQPTSVEAEPRQASEPKPRTYDALPADAKAQCERFMKSIPGFSKEEYVQNYDWDDA